MFRIYKGPNNKKSKSIQKQTDFSRYFAKEGIREANKHRKALNILRLGLTRIKTTMQELKYSKTRTQVNYGAFVRKAYYPPSKIYILLFRIT